MTKGYTETGEHKFHGTGDWNACYDMVKVLLNDTLRKVEIPSMTMREFYGISTFGMFQDFVAREVPIKSLADLRNQSQTFASLDWKECQIEYPHAGDYLRTYFFMGVWCYAVLEYGFNMTAPSAYDFTFARDIAGVSLGWDLGALVSYAYEVYIEDSGRLSLGVIVGVSTGLMVVSFAGFIVFLLMVRRNASIQLILSM
jgi:hypothetical protein